jgi:hypothetical protein
MSPTQKNLLLVACVSAVVIPGVFSFYLWSARIDRRTTPEVACFHNLRQIDGAEEQWALENHKTTNDTPTWTDLQGYLISTNIRCPVGGDYSLTRIGEPPKCSIPEHAARYRKDRAQAWSPGQ